MECPSCHVEMSFEPATVQYRDGGDGPMRDTWSCDCGEIVEGQTLAEKREEGRDADEQWERENGPSRTSRA